MRETNEFVPPEASGEINLDKDPTPEQQARYKELMNFVGQPSAEQQAELRSLQLLMDARTERNKRAARGY